MNVKNIESRFAEIGARLKVREVASRWRMGVRKWIDPVNYAVDMRRDRDGAFFELRVPTHLSETVKATVLQSEPKQRHRSCSSAKPNHREAFYESASRFAFPSCSSKAEHPADNRKTQERYLPGRPTYAVCKHPE